MNLSTRLQTIILTSLLLGLLFSLAILPSSAFAEQNNNQSVSCAVSFDWTGERNPQYSYPENYGIPLDGGRYHIKLYENNRGVVFEDKHYESKKFSKDITFSHVENEKDKLFRLWIRDPGFFGIGGPTQNLSYTCPIPTPAPTTQTTNIPPANTQEGLFSSDLGKGNCAVSFTVKKKASKINDVNEEKIIYLFKEMSAAESNSPTMFIGQYVVNKTINTIEFTSTENRNYKILDDDTWSGWAAAVCPSKSATPSPATTLQKGEAGGDISGEEKSIPVSEDIGKKTTPTVPPVADPTPTISPTSAPPAASSPSPTQKATPTTTNEQPVGAGGQTGQANSCPTNLSNVSADADGQDGVTIRDFNKIRTCVKNGSTNQTQLPFSGETGWAMAVWKKAFLAK